MRDFSRRGVVGLAASVLSLALPTPATAAPRADLWNRWTAHDDASTLEVDHAAWADFLAAHVVPGEDGVNRVDYGGVDAAARGLLGRYIAGLAATPVSRLARAEQKAFWANLYNALTVRVVLDHYPVATIRDIDISPGFFADGPWGKKLVTVEGEPVSLDDIEHRILRPIWRDPRIHYAVNCASIGCPNLAVTPFTADHLDAQLDVAARAFVNHPRGARIDADGDLRVSSIYSWFEADFGGNDAGVIAHLRRFAEAPLSESLARVSSVDGHDYDWALNDVKP